MFLKVAVKVTKQGENDVKTPRTRVEFVDSRRVSAFDSRCVSGGLRAKAQGAFYTCDEVVHPVFSVSFSADENYTKY